MEKKETLNRLSDLCDRVEDQIASWHRQWPDSAGRSEEITSKMKVLIEQQGPEFAARWNFMEYMLEMSLEYHELVLDWLSPPQTEEETAPPEKEG